MAPPVALGLRSELCRLGLRDVRALEAPRATPEDVWLGTAQSEHGSAVALVCTRRSGAELVGWARVAVHLAGPEIREVLALAPVVRPEARDAAQRLARGPSIRLISAPSLASPADPLFVEEAARPPADPGFGPARTLYDRVLRALEGGAVVTDAGGVRRTEQGFLLYVRGVRVAEITRDGDGVRVNVLTPERQHLFVTDASFPRFGPDLHELIVRLAQDPRLASAGRDDALALAAGEGVGVRIVARWMPWNATGEDPIDWTGVDDRGRPVLAWMRESFELSDVPAVLSALQRLETERDAWAPGSRGRPRILLSTRQIDPRARTLVASFEADLESVSPAAAAPALAPAAESELLRRGRRGRRRRGRRGEDFVREPALLQSEPALEEDGVDLLDAPSDEPEAERMQDVDELRPDLTSTPFDEPEPDELAQLEEIDSTLEPLEASEDPPGRRRRSRGRRGGRGRARRALRSDAASPATPGAGPPEPDDPRAGAEDEPVERVEDDEEETPVESELQGAGEGPIAAGEALEDEPEDASGEEPIDRPPRRHPRAALCVRNDPDSLLAALVLARERRHISFYYVCAQEQLMDFFRGKATDLDDGADLLLVGFTAQPVPKEVIAAAGLYRGRIEWFDHHEWPIEDVEMLRDAIGREAIAFAEAGASPLAAVMTVAERRSRFTDKLVDLAGRRLSEADMEKWGYRLIGLLHRVAATRGDHRAEVMPVLAGRPTDLPEVPEVYAEEARWMDSHDPRVVLFGEYRMAVVRAPAGLDAGELGRRARLRTGSRLSLASREGDEVVLLGCSEEKRHMNLLGLVEQLANTLPWLHPRAGGDRGGRLQIDQLEAHPERFERTIGEIVRHKSVLYG